MITLVLWIMIQSLAKRGGGKMTFMFFCNDCKEWFTEDEYMRHNVVHSFKKPITKEEYDRLMNEGVKNGCDER